MQVSNPRAATRLSRLMIAASARANYEWALRLPGTAPFVVLTEFPRSGGNWIRDMIGDALQMPVPRFARLPVTFRAIIHNHDHRPSQHPTVYVVRDPRDVFVSHFHKTVTTLQSGPLSLQRRILRLHPSLRCIFSKTDPKAALGEEFYEEWLKRPLGARVPWHVHVSSFLSERKDNISVIRYEDARADGAAALSQLIMSLTGTEPAVDAVDFAVRRNEFTRQSGRRPGEVDNTATKRQGIVGAWRNDLPPALSERFRADMASELAMAGYEV